MRKRILVKFLLFAFAFLLLAPMHTEAAKKQGWQKSGFYYENGKKVKNALKKINGSYYYFDKKGKTVKKAMMTIKGKRYYFRGGGKAAKGWVTYRKEKYYFNEKCRGVTGLVQIGKNKYFFDEDGVMQTGWQIIGNKKAYFYGKTGRMAKNRTIDGQKINKKGFAKLTHKDKARQDAMDQAEEILKAITTSGMSQAQKLSAAFQYMTNRGRFGYRTWRNFQVYDGWEYDYALEIFEKRAGNCYNFACGFAVLAKAIGYDAYVVTGRVPGTRDGAGDGMTRHALVTINGLYYDPEAQFAGWASGIYGLSGYPMSLQVTGSSKV